MALAERRTSARRRDGQRSPGLWQPVCDTLQEDIIFGRLKPRERLVEDEIIARFAGTRHAVRRAFDELERLGLVVRHPNRGIQVRDYALQEIEDLYEIREVLETRAVERIALPAERSIIDRLTRLAEDHRKASEEDRFLDLFRLNNEFHEAFYAAAGNPALAEAIRYYSVATHPIRSRGFPDPELRRMAVSEHMAMIEALAAGDREALKTVCVRHIMRPKQFYLDANRLD